MTGNADGRNQLQTDLYLARFRRKIAVNAASWLAYVRQHSGDTAALDREMDNLRKAIQQALAEQEAWESGLALTGEAWRHVEQRGYWLAWRGLLKQALEVSRQAGRPADEAFLLDQMGELARESAQGLIDILRLRAEFKHEFYVPATSIAPVANNVFKYSVNASEAMSRLASADGREAYLGAAESTRQAFQDLAAHQLALIAGMEAAVDALLQRFSPAALEERIGRATMLEGVMPQVRRARMWEAFEHEYRQIAQQAADDFQQILGQHFARAYAEQIKRLERAGFGGKPEDNE